MKLLAFSEVIGAILKPWTTSRTLAEIRETFDSHGVCWGPGVVAGSIRA